MRSVFEGGGGRRISVSADSGGTLAEGISDKESCCCDGVAAAIIVYHAATMVPPKMPNDRCCTLAQQENGNTSSEMICPWCSEITVDKRHDYFRDLNANSDRAKEDDFALWMWVAQSSLCKRVSSNSL
eukprot:Gb_39334 [translate_table: standard]